jgi:hypothetical protein
MDGGLIILGGDGDGKVAYLVESMLPTKLRLSLRCQHAKRQEGYGGERLLHSFTVLKHNVLLFHFSPAKLRLSPLFHFRGGFFFYSECSIPHGFESLLRQRDEMS